MISVLDRGTRYGVLRMASLRDVAERAGVSVATASRVVSGSAAVRPETRQKVERAMRELLYVAPDRPGTSRAMGSKTRAASLRKSSRWKKPSA